MKKKTDNFDKFYPTKKNSAIKEQFKQEKKKWKKERSEAIEVQKKKARLPVEAQATVVKPSSRARLRATLTTRSLNERVG